MLGMKAESNLSFQDEAGATNSFYHTGNGSRVQKGKYVDKSTRQFIAWDGEGVTPEKGKPQNYVLFGVSTHERITGHRLTTDECLEFIVEIGKKYPHAWHVAFAFDYDVNMILRDLHESKFKQIRSSDRNQTRYGDYVIQHVPGKWFRVTHYGEEGKTSVTIYDLFGFFQMSFVKAVRKWIPKHHRKMSQFELVESGKKHRPDFSYNEMDLIVTYWEIEIDVLQLLAESLRESLYDVDLTIAKWHGPGAIASHVYEKNHIQDCKLITPPDIYDASRYGYAGGRFEMFRLGRFEGPIYGLDINSAYPFGISMLPNLANGEWVWKDTYDPYVEFAIWRVRYFKNEPYRGMRDFVNPGPVFFRDPKGAVSFPWSIDGWYWSPEVGVMMMKGHFDLDIMGGWAFIPNDPEERPFTFVQEMYDERREMKRLGMGSEKAIKLALNSLYGKMAQRAGWKAAGGAPRWHQLEWAGFVTSTCRAMIYNMMGQLGFDTIIGVETDGIYTTRNPSEVGITDSPLLGEWEVSKYDELMYLQSGMYAKRQGSSWDCKYRGLDSDTLSADSIGEYLSELGPLTKGESWPTFQRGSTTRFVGYPAALKMQGPFRSHHAIWRTQSPEINPAISGKRSHSPVNCPACMSGKSAYEMPHQMFISSMGQLMRYPRTDLPTSNRHDIPWSEDVPTSEWRDVEELEAGQYGIGY